jgi:hypothetical protein
MHGAHTLTFNAVTPCHIAVLPLLASGTLPHFTFSKKTYFIMEKTAHATLQINRGLLQQFGEVVRIDFQDKARIEEAFRYAASQGLTPISVSDSVGSMGGVAPVAHIVRLAHQYDGYAYIDDAHGTSIYESTVPDTLCHASAIGLTSVLLSPARYLKPLAHTADLSPVATLRPSNLLRPTAQPTPLVGRLHCLELPPA